MNYELKEVLRLMNKTGAKVHISVTAPHEYMNLTEIAGVNLEGEYMEGLIHFMNTFCEQIDETE